VSILIVSCFVLSRFPLSILIVSFIYLDFVLKIAAAFRGRAGWPGI
jgi:hypothetical protein